MKKKYLHFLCAAAIGCMLASGCGKAGNPADAAQSESITAAETGESENVGSKPAESETAEPKTAESKPAESKTADAPVADGVYVVEFDSDSSMFHVNEAHDGKGTLTVTDGEMVLHISLPSKNILHLYPGLAADAEKDEANILNPTMDSVTYSDGFMEEVHGFDIPVPVLGEEFDLALVGKKGKWYDHKVSVSYPLEEENENGSEKSTGGRTAAAGLSDGSYTVDVALEGGSGRASIESPASFTVKDGEAWVKIVWSSSNYDYMKVDGETYFPVNKEGNSVFELPADMSSEKMDMIADTTAMGTPHEIEYTITFQWDSVKTEALPLANEREMELDYAEEFAVKYYEGGYALIAISDGSRFFIVPEGAETPEGLEDDIVVLKQPVDQIYLAASAVMDMFAALDAVDAIRLSGTREDGWYIQEAKDAMASGAVSYAGKYSAPDYEKILSTGCDLSVQSTMILHAPEVKENLESFGIPVLIDRSSYESHPLGRSEWVKLYGVLLGKEEEAEKAFEKQKAALESIPSDAKTDKTVAFFYITTNGAVNVRKSGDYVPKMIELAGGTYVFSDLGDKTASSSVNMQMEEFYARAKDADYLIYNSTIDGGVGTRAELLQKSPLFAEFRAFSEGNVFCTGQNFYQESMEMGTFIQDVYKMLTENTKQDEQTSGQDSSTYLFRLK